MCTDSTSRMRIAIGSITHESNTFSTLRTDLASFRNTQFLAGDEITSYHMDKSTEIGGIMHALENENVEIVPTFSAAACPSGVVRGKTFAFIKERLLTPIENAKEIDAVLLVLHGAMVTNDLNDPEGYLLEAVRRVVGSGVPIGVTLDLHANMSKLMVENADFIVGYRTHPHVDRWSTGQRAAKIMLSVIREKISTTMALKRLPMILPGAVSMEPREALLEKIIALEQEDGVLTASFFLGYPWADVDVAGSSVVVATKGDTEVAAHHANEIARLFWSLRKDFPLKIPSIEDALDQALAVKGQPVVLCDVGDNPFGGAAEDVPTLLSAILQRKIENVALAVIVDPEAVQKAMQAGTKRELVLDLGGKLDRINGQPLRVKGRVKLITSENRLDESIFSGYEASMGHIVVFEVDRNVGIVVAEHGGRVYEPAFFRNLDITPEHKKIIVVKGALTVARAHEKIAERVILVNTPGCCNRDLKSLRYNHVPRPIFPLDDLEEME